MGETLENLMVGVGGDTSGLSRSLAGISPMLGKLGGMLTSTGGMIGTAFAAAGVGIALFSVNAAKEIGAGFRIIKQRTGEVGPTLDQLGQNYRKVFSQVPDDAKAVGEAMSMIHQRTGEVGKPLEDMTTKLMNLARITESDVKPLTDSATGAMNVWNIAAKDQGSALDYLYKVSAATGANINTLTESTRTAAPVTQMLGWSFEKTAAFTGQMTKQGIDANGVFNGMKMSLGKLAKAGKDPQTEFPKMMGAIKGAKTETEALQIAIELFGARMAGKLVGPIRQGKLNVDDFMGSLKKGGPTINEVADRTLTFGQRLTLLGHNAKLIMEPIGKGILTALNYAVKGLIAAAQWVMEFIKKLQAGEGPFKKAHDTIVNVFNGIKEAVSVWFKVITELWDRFGKIWLNQLVAVFTAIWNIIKAAFDIIKGIWDVFAGIFSGDWSRVWHGIKAIFGGIWDAIKAVFILIWETIKSYAHAVWNAICGIASVVWDKIKGVLTGIWNAIVFVAKAIWDGIRAYFEFLWNVVTTIFSTAWDIIKGAVTAVWNAIVWVAQTVWNGLKNFFIDLWEGIKIIFSTAWDIIKGTLEAIWNTICTVASTVWGVIKTVVGTVWDGLAAAWGFVWGGIKAVVEGVWNSFQWMYDHILVPVYNALCAVWDGLSGAWSKVWDGIVAVVKGAVNLIIKGVNLAIKAINWLKPGEDIPYLSEWHHLGGLIGGAGNVPMMGEAGEFMQQKSAVKKYGVGFMESVNAGTYEPGAGGTINVGDVHFHSVSPEYDVKQFYKLLNDTARRGAHLGRVLKGAKA